MREPGGVAGGGVGIGARVALWNCCGRRLRYMWDTAASFAKHKW
jgi:hypothetical protein